VKGKKRKQDYVRPFYSLKEVRTLIETERVLVTVNALVKAQKDFGWGMDDILNAVKSLRLKDFHKYEQARIDPKIVVDFYKAYGLKGEDVYTHFYIDDETGTLIINSFKKIEGMP